jgi:hypothetical protein
MKVRTNVNDTGIQEIREFLAQNHRLGWFSAPELNAWAADAERQIGEGNLPTIEIKSWDSVHGRTQEFTVSDAGCDWGQE